MICDLGDVVVVPFPFVDVAAEKRRPSLVLSRRTFNRSSGHSICAMITTAGRTRWPSDVTIDDLAAAGLPRACVVRWKLFTLPSGTQLISVSLSPIDSVIFDSSGSLAPSVTGGSVVVGGQNGDLDTLLISATGLVYRP